MSSPAVPVREGLNDKRCKSAGALIGSAQGSRASVSIFALSPFAHASQ
jgi:hypothetical protein